jgi:hypothetical protein
VAPTVVTLSTYTDLSHFINYTYWSGTLAMAFGCGPAKCGYGMCAAVMFVGYSILIASTGFILLALNAEYADDKIISNNKISVTITKIRAPGSIR